MSLPSGKRAIGGLVVFVIAVAAYISLRPSDDVVPEVPLPAQAASGPAATPAAAASGTASASSGQPAAGGSQAAGGGRTSSSPEPVEASTGTGTDGNEPDGGGPVARLPYRMEIVYLQGPNGYAAQPANGAMDVCAPPGVGATIEVSTQEPGGFDVWIYTDPPLRADVVPGGPHTFQIRSDLAPRAYQISVDYEGDDDPGNDDLLGRVVTDGSC